MLVPSLVCLAALLLLIYFDYRKRPSRLRWLRILLTVLAVAALWLLAVRPSVPATADPRKAVLLTGQVDQRLADSILSHSEEVHYRFRLATDTSHLDFIPLPDMSYLRRNYPDISELLLVGDGLPEAERQALEGLQLRFVPSRVDGLVYAGWKKQLSLEEDFIVQGTYRKRDSAPVWLYLGMAGNNVDSAEIKGTGEQAFELRAKAKESGRFLFSLEEKDDHKKQLRSEKLDVEISRPQPVRTLVLLNAPEPETRFLKETLGKKGHSFAIRMRVSKDNYRFEYINRREIGLKSITTALLSDMDLLLVDLETLMQLSPAEKNTIQRAVTAGLGLFVFPDHRDLAQVKLPALFDYRFQKEKEAEPALTKVYLYNRYDKPDSAKQGATPLMALPYRMAAETGTSYTRLHLLAKDDFGQGLVGYRLQGQGKMGTGLLQQTYQWLLEGNEAEYLSYWSALIGALARRETLPAQWTVPEPLPVVNTPLTLELETATAIPAGVAWPENQRNLQDSIYLKQNFRESYRWQGNYWPYQSGWYQVSNRETDIHYFFVFNESDWQSVRRAQQIRQTQEFIDGFARLPSATTRQLIPVEHPVPAYFFFILFVISLALLWIIEKSTKY